MKNLVISSVALLSSSVLSGPLPDGDRRQTSTSQTTTAALSSSLQPVLNSNWVSNSCTSTVISSGRSDDNSWSAVKYTCNTTYACPADFFSLSSSENLITDTLLIYANVTNSRVNGYWCNSNDIRAISNGFGTGLNDPYNPALLSSLSPDCLFGGLSGNFLISSGLYNGIKYTFTTFSLPVFGPAKCPSSVFVFFSTKFQPILLGTKPVM